ncbi:uncharacterized protein Z518_05220 [Rhinocladiella mackenziei CBS 650.93]|uniref:Vegetative cell wall protein gp1 n=1 Tax=Rhinocladiella mackenziei CBS 650.93 TaxID=1442369 RepID=A0A0D2FQ75_9EURO|nr:uncharacterized protein Z518_05220 [Rhinocladiella mackenziei CBS 650.93]KIX04352.1 hypothetical protein Z518_05220 [Rhinocladiella mackenziei CBS 650.93]
MSYHYSVPPPHYAKYYGGSPYSSGEYVHYAPQYETTPKRHARKASYNPSPRVGGWYSPAGSPPPFYEANVQYAVPRDEVYVSEATGKSRKHESYNTFPSSRYHTRSSSRKQNQPIYVYDGEAEYAGVQATYILREPKSKSKHTRKPSTDTYFYYGQGQIIDEQPKRSRARRSSTTTKPSPKSKSSQPKPTPQATEADAIREGIPAGYSIKHWDPTELPIILLGSVFDANSLGKWIYDWTVFHHGASTPMADMAGELWLLLIKLAGKMKRAEECVGRIKNLEKQETVEDFIISGQRLWEKFKGLLKDCEHYMLKAAKRDGTKTMGKKAGTEFVDSIFGRDRHLEATERIMNQIRLWNMRFDVNCEDTLRRPSVA